jgi:hypothetical protein
MEFVVATVARIAGLVARPFLRLTMAVMVSFFIALPTGYGVHWLIGVVIDIVLPWCVAQLKRWGRVLLVSLLTCALTGLLVDYALGQPELLDEAVDHVYMGLGALYASGGNVHHAVCAWARVPRILCPRTNATVVL